MRRQPPGHSLQATALVHEALMRLWGGSAPSTEPSRAYLFTAVARAMREVLVDHARRRASKKRGDGWRRYPLDAVVDRCAAQAIELLALDEALETFRGHHPRAASVVALRFFGGYTEEEVAAELAVSLATVQRDFQFARAWLRRHLQEETRDE